MKFPIVFSSVCLLGCALVHRGACAGAESAPVRGTSKQKPAGWTINGEAFSGARAIDAGDFGLTANSTNDQSANLAKAIGHAASRPDIDTVYVPAGVYYVPGGIVLKAGVNLVGDGPGKTVFEGGGESKYLVTAKRTDFAGALVANLTLSNRRRTLLMQQVKNLRFANAEFRGGMVRFEQSSDLALEGNVFNDNLGKAGYASHGCENVRIVGNTFNSVENGSINLSGHTNCYVASNTITSPALIDSGYAGIRLPNGAKSNVVEHNVIENHGRGLFILSGSQGNIVRSNTVKGTTYQGAFIQSSGNTLEGNTIIDAGNEAIYVVDGTAASSPTPSLARGNKITGNTIRDTRAHEGPRFVGLRVSSGGNTVEGNTVSGAFGRKFKEIKEGNVDARNTYSPGGDN